MVAFCSVLAGADDFVAIEAWAEEKLDCFRRCLTLEKRFPPHYTFGRIIATIDAEEFGAASEPLVGSVAPALAKEEVVAIDDKSQPAFAQVGRHAAAPGKRLCRQCGISVGKTSDSGLIEREDCDLPAIGNLGAGRLHGHQRYLGHPTRHCRDPSGSGCRLNIWSAKRNQLTLYDSIRDDFVAFQTDPRRTPDHVDEMAKKDYRRLEMRALTRLQPVAGRPL